MVFCKQFLPLFLTVIIAAPSSEAWYSNQIKRDTNPEVTADVPPPESHDVKQDITQPNPNTSDMKAKVDVDQVGKLGAVPPLDKPQEVASAAKMDEAVKKEKPAIKLTYEAKKDAITAEERKMEDDLLTKLISMLSQSVPKSEEHGKDKHIGSIDDEMKKFWDMFYYKDESKKTAVGEEAKTDDKVRKTKVGVEKRVLSDVEPKIEEKEHHVGTKSLFDLEESVFDHKFDAEKPKAPKPAKRVVPKVVYADEAEERKLEEELKGILAKDDKHAQEAKKKEKDHDIHKYLPDEKVDEHKKKKEHVDESVKKSRDRKVDEEKAHEERTAAVDPRQVFRGYFPSLGADDTGHDDDDSLDGSSSEEDDDDDDEEEDGSFWLRRAIARDGIGSRIPLFLDSSLNLDVPIRIPSIPGYGDSDDGEEEQFSRLTDETETNGEIKKLEEEVKKLELPFLYQRSAPVRYGLLLYPWVALKDLVEKVDDVMKELNLKAAEEEVATGVPPLEYKFEVIEVKSKKFLIIAKSVKDPEGKKKTRVLLESVKPVTEDEVKKIEELKEEKKIVDELLARKKELHDLWIKRREGEEKKEELKNEKFKEIIENNSDEDFK